MLALELLCAMPVCSQLTPGLGGVTIESMIRTESEVRDGSLDQLTLSVQHRGYQKAAITGKGAVFRYRTKHSRGCWAADQGSCSRVGCQGRCGPQKVQVCRTHGPLKHCRACIRVLSHERHRYMRLARCTTYSMAVLPKCPCCWQQSRIKQ